MIGRTPVSSQKRISRASSSRVPMVDPITRSCRKKIRFSSVADGFGPDVAPEMTTVPPGRNDRSECAQVAAPTVSMTASTRSGSLAPLANARSAPSSSALACLSSCRLVDPDPEPGSRAQPDQGGRDAAAGALHEDGVAGPQPRLREEHPVGRQPRRRQAGRLLPAQRRRLGHEVAPRDDDLVGERALIPLRQQGPLGVHRLVAAELRVADDGVHDDLLPVVRHPGRVAAEDHRQELLRQADPAQAPEVVVVQARRAHVDARPAVRHLGSGRSPTSSAVSGSSGAVRAA